MSLLALRGDVVLRLGLAEAVLRFLDFMIHKGSGHEIWLQRGSADAMRFFPDRNNPMVQLARTLLRVREFGVCAKFRHASLQRTRREANMKKAGSTVSIPAILLM